MDVVITENVPNSLLVVGLSDTEADEELIDYLKKYGSIERMLKVNSADPKFRKSAIIEFQNGAAIRSLQSQLLLNRPISASSNIICHIQLLSEVYADSRGTGLTTSYLTELRDVAKQSGIDFEKLLLDVLEKIKDSTRGESLSETENVDIEPDPLHNFNTLTVASPGEGDNLPSGKPEIHAADDCLPHFSMGAGASFTRKKPLLPEQLSPSEVQRVVVEYVVKSTDISAQYHSGPKLRCFSGKSLCRKWR